MRPVLQASPDLPWSPEHSALHIWIKSHPESLHVDSLYPIQFQEFYS